MTLQEIKSAIAEGKTVHWSNKGYKVVKTFDYFIKHESGSMIGLTWADGETLNGEEEEFFISYGEV